MSRITDVITRLEQVAKRFEMSVEEAVSILEGKHPNHIVVTKPVAENPTASVATANSTTESTTTSASIAATTSTSEPTTVAENPTVGGAASEQDSLGAANETEE